MRGASEDQEKTELLVFGYACKLFRDDERAASIDSGGHLIPWMGDDSLKIDRYDGRGALYDLAAHEPKDSYLEEVGEEEKALEQLCEEERYRSLYINEDEELTYKEEEAKRQHHQSQSYGEVAYSYDVPSAPVEEVASQVVHPTAGRPFVPSTELQIPPDMITPKTAKHNAIIERTALFLAQQGSQMEILMKVKQQGNKNFEFLSHADPLNNYYLHLKGLIKSGSYVPREQEFEEEEVAEPEEDDGNYLHPSLITARTTTAQTSGTPPPQASNDDQRTTPKPPPTDNNAPPDFVQKIIEVMVKFVIKNGLRFETVIMKKGDVRFSFLNPKNPYNAFYKQQLEMKQNEIDGKPSKTRVAKVPDSDSQDAKPTLKRKPLPVCFSIKKPKESEGLEVPSALPVEESSDEEDAGTATPPKQPKTSDSPNDVVEPLSATLEKQLRKAMASSKKSRSKKDVTVQKERKIKVAQFLKDLKKKNLE
uniref:Protein suppressor of white apricot n=2 Tax=Lygus hesperus TaxID=30085 RepID=A0A146MCL0_LYGHE